MLVYAKCSIDLRGRSSLRNVLYRDTDLVKSVFGFNKTMLDQCYLSLGLSLPGASSRSAFL